MRYSPRSSLTGYLLLYLLFVLALGAFGWTGLLLASLILAAVALAVFAVAHLLQEECPSCRARGTIGWKHARADGGPDGRFKSNFRYCRACNAKDPFLVEVRQPPRSR